MDDTPAVRVHNYDQLDGNPGAYQITGPAEGTGARSILIACPCGCAAISALPIRKAEETDADRPCWLWDGNEDTPTLTPSIRRLDGCKWHGFLRAGRWVTA